MRLMQQERVQTDGSEDKFKDIEIVWIYKLSFRMAIHHFIPFFLAVRELLCFRGSIVLYFRITGREMNINACGGASVGFFMSDVEILYANKYGRRHFWQIQH